jgi:polar amino acid transport system permease protein
MTNRPHESRSRWTRLFLAPAPGAEEALPWCARLANWLIALAALSAVFAFAFHQLQYAWNWNGVMAYRSAFFQGWLMTVLISLAALVLSSFLGLVVALSRRARLLPLRCLAQLYVELIRGTPLLVQIYVFFYVIADAFHFENRYVMGIVILSLFSGAYISEIIRAGIESVGKSQIESAKAIGLTRAQTYRYVIFPQALRQTLPPMAGQLVSLIKDSSLLSIIAIDEFTHNASKVSSTTASPFESYLPLAAGYLLLTLPISVWTRRIEEKHRYET